MTGMLTEIRQALRSLRRAPGLSVISILTVTLVTATGGAWRAC